MFARMGIRLYLCCIKLTEMRKSYVICTLLACLLAWCGTAPAGAQALSNISVRALRVAASASAAGHGPELVCDNRTAQSNYWSSYTGEASLGSEAYVELQWDRSYAIKEVRAYWAVTGTYVVLPTEAYAAWWDGTGWQRGTSLAAADASNLSTTATDITTRALRICLRSEQAVGIRELRIMGYAADPTENYQWPAYEPTLSYDYRSEYPALNPPTKMLPENNNQKGYVADGWWAVAWGPDLNAHVTEAAKQGLLAKMNEDFAFFRDQMGWPPDKRARNGYYSTVYIYGSGLYSDGATKYDRGGWQGATWYNGSSWPMVNLSYYPVACFDPAFTNDNDNPNYTPWTVTDQTFQQNACVHEGIHAIFADLEGCKNSAWYQEAGNTWLQGEAELVKTGKTPESMGFLSAGNMIAPFMPIECYSGWLLDDTFGGPSAEGVNMYNGSQQVCTWRNLLGGMQYGELFPHFVSEILGRGSIPWIWRYCRNRVLDGMADSLGERQMRHLVLEYRARQAMIDVGQWSNACRKLLDDNWLLTVQQEWSPYWKKVDPWQATPYANMYRCNEVDSAGWWRPEWRTTPGWSGANQVPLHVAGQAGDVISLHFKPLGTNMVCMLCYRTKQGRVYYSLPVEGEGDVVMKLQGEPANKVVIAVIVNTDYLYQGDETRKKHFDYRLRMGENIYQPAKAQLKWYNYRSTIRDQEFITGIETVAPEAEPARFAIHPERSVVRRGEQVALHIAAASQLQVPVRLFDQSGRQLHSQSFLRDGLYQIPASLAPGIYILQGVNGRETSTARIVVK